jgi:excinuclease UvrABC helicase subunit UvrB
VPDADYSVDLKALLVAEEEAAYEAEAKGKPRSVLPADVEALRKQMREAAANLEFEKAAHLRDKIRALEQG